MKIVSLLLILLTTSLFSSETHFWVSSNGSEVTAPIFVCSLDTNSGEVKLVDTYEGVYSPSFLVRSSDGTRLYTVVGGNPSKVSVWEVDPKTSEMSLLKVAEMNTAGACHLSLSQDEQSLFVANYSSGEIAVLSIDDNGVVGEVSQVLKFEGSGPDKSRQKSSHMHYIHPMSDGNFVLAADLGTDKVMIYNYDDTTATLIENANQPFLKTAPGAGPRHLDFHPTHPWIYLLNELTATVNTIAFDFETQELEIIQCIALMPEGFEGFNKSAAIHVHPSGKFVYGSNRGDSDSITVFKTAIDGTLEFVERQVEGIDWPRDFNIDPTGKYLISAGRDANEIRVFEINLQDGSLTPTDHCLSLPFPVCVIF